MKDTRPFEGIVSVISSGELSDQKRLSVLSWNVRDRKRGEVSNSLVGSFHVIMVQEAESHYHEIAKNAEQQFRMYHGADQLILDHKNTWGPEGTKIEGRDPGRVKARLLACRADPG